jgi:NAD+ kinase
VIRGQDGIKEHALMALNDMVISREGLSRLLRLDVLVGAEKLTGFAGDGIIVSTPTGSTAYSLSAGGAIVHPKVDALVITPICPHASALRCLVVDQNEKITVRIRSSQGPAKALLTADGQENVEIDDSYSIEITRSGKRLKLIKSSKRSYFATLRENFKFPE